MRARLWCKVSRESNFCAFIMNVLECYGQDVLAAGGTSVALKVAYGQAIVDRAFGLFEFLVLEEVEKNETVPSGVSVWEN